MNNYCNVHTEFIEEQKKFVQQISKLTENVKWLSRIGRWAIYTLVVVGISVLGAVGTFTYKASDVFAQVRVNTSMITDIKDRDDRLVDTLIERFKEEIHYAKEEKEER